jgi:hypothetical protein
MREFNGRPYVVEPNEGFFTMEIDEEEKDKSLKRGRGSRKKTKVLVMAEGVPLEGGAQKTSFLPHFL